MLIYKEYRPTARVTAVSLADDRCNIGSAKHARGQRAGGRSYIALAC